MGREIEVSIARRTLDVPSFLNDIPNFVKDVLNFLKNVPRIPKSVLGCRTTSNHCLRPQNEQMDHGKRDRGLDSMRI